MRFTEKDLDSIECESPTAFKKYQNNCKIEQQNSKSGMISVPYFSNNSTAEQSDQNKQGLNYNNYNNYDDQNNQNNYYNITD